MKEIISIHIGQTGIQLGGAIWPLFCQEHHISPNGVIDNIFATDSLKKFFNETATGIYRTRSVFVDLEPTSIHQLRTGRYRGLFGWEQLASGKNSSGGVYARGRRIGEETVVEQALERVRRAAEQCQQLQGFIIYHSMGGGSGSGLTVAFRQKLVEVYAGKLFFHFSLFPSGCSSESCLQPYNSVMAAYQLLEMQDFGLIFDNSALTSICQKNLNIQIPTFNQFNAITAQTVSALTCSMRFDEALNFSLEELYQKTVPHPRISFLCSSYTPFITKERAYIDQSNVKEMTHTLFDPVNQLASIDSRQSKLIASSIYFRGENIVNADVSQACRDLKGTIDFVDWNPGAFKAGINRHRPISSSVLKFPPLTKDILAIMNTPVISDLFARNLYNFDMLFSKRSFWHWYQQEGVELDQFIEMRQEFTIILGDYQYAEKDDD